jgi:hypothetical protein
MDGREVVVFITLHHLGERAAKAKKRAKAVEGNCWVGEG